jgi:hypothetical protein
VLILQNINGAKAIDVKKNRFSGNTGSVPLVFDPVSIMYREKGSKPLQGGILSLDDSREEATPPPLSAASPPPTPSHFQQRLVQLGLLGGPDGGSKASPVQPPAPAVQQQAQSVTARAVSQSYPATSAVSPASMMFPFAVAAKPMAPKKAVVEAPDDDGPDQLPDEPGPISDEHGQPANNAWPEDDILVR